MTPSILVAIIMSIMTMVKPYSHAHELSYRQTRCLTEAVYREARGEQMVGQIAVAYVVLNRSKITGDSICTTIHKPNQFSYTRYRHRRVSEKMAWELAAEVAVYTQIGFFSNPVGEATYYNTVPVKSWGPVKLVKKIGHHMFFKDKKDAGKLQYIKDCAAIEHMVGGYHIDSDSSRTQYAFIDQRHNELFHHHISSIFQHRHMSYSRWALAPTTLYIGDIKYVTT